MPLPKNVRVGKFRTTGAEQTLTQRRPRPVMPKTRVIIMHLWCYLLYFVYYRIEISICLKENHVHYQCF
jgi:hypothetical protein